MIIISEMPVWVAVDEAVNIINAHLKKIKTI